MAQQERIITDYFKAWLNKDISCLKEYFSDNAVYIECYGPAYNGLSEIENWFSDWIKQGEVLIWDIKRFISVGNSVACEWYFKCEYQGNTDEFDGVSLIDFDSDNKIIRLKEFQCKVPNYYPYSN